MAGRLVRISAPDGTSGTIPEEEVDSALSQGYRLPLGDDASFAEKATDTLAGAADVAASVGTGAIEGLTGGLAGMAVGALGDQTTKDIYKGFGERSPIAHGAGQVLGMVTSPIGEVGKALEGSVKATTTLGRIGATALGAGVENAIFGAGADLSEQMLGDANLNGQKLIAAAGLGGLLGAAGGGLGAAIGEGVSAGVRKIGEAFPKKGLEDFAETRWLKAGGAIQSDLKRIPPEDRAAVADVIRQHMSPGDKLLPKNLDDAMVSMQAEREGLATTVAGELGVGDMGGLAPKMGQDEALEAVARGLEANGKKSAEVLAKAEAMGAAPEYNRVFSRLDDFESGLNPAERDLVVGDLKKYRGYIEELATRPGPTSGKSGGGFSALNDLKSTLQKDTNWTADGAAKFGLKRQLAGILRDEIDTQLAPQIGSGLSKEFLDAKAAYGLLSKAEKALGRKTSTGADAIAAMVENAGLKSPAAARLSALEHASRLAQHGIDRATGNRWLSPSDYLTGLGGIAMAGNPLTALASSVGHKILREKGSAVIASLADRIARSPGLSVIAKSLAQKATAPALMPERYGGILANAFAQSDAMGLATHTAMAQLDPAYQEAATLAGIPQVDPLDPTVTMGRAQQLAAIQTAVAQIDASIDRHISRVIAGGKAPPSNDGALGHQDFGGRRMRRTGDAAFERRVEEVRELAGNPEAIAERLSQNTGGLGETAPGMVAAQAQSIARAAKYLANLDSEPAARPPLAQKWAYSQDDRHRFLEALGVIEQPLSVLEHAAAGTLTGGHVRALRAAYPELADSIAARVAERLTEGPKVPYAQRAQLATLAGVDVDGTLSPAVLMANQDTIRKTRMGSQKPSERTGGGPATGKGLDKLSVAKRMAPPGQHKEATAEE